MSLLKTVKPEEATGLVAEIYKPIQEMMGVVPAPMQLMSASPGMMAARMPMMKYYMEHPTPERGAFGLDTHAGGRRNPVQLLHLLEPGDP
jgi:hypothetical protein